MLLVISHDSQETNNSGQIDALLAEVSRTENNVIIIII